MYKKLRRFSRKAENIGKMMFLTYNILGHTDGTDLWQVGYINKQLKIYDYGF